MFDGLFALFDELSAAIDTINIVGAEIETFLNNAATWFNELNALMNKLQPYVIIGYLAIIITFIMTLFCLLFLIKINKKIYLIEQEEAEQDKP